MIRLLQKLLPNSYSTFVFLHPTCIMEHLSTLKSICQSFTHLNNLLRSSCSVFTSSFLQTLLANLVLSANLDILDNIPSSKSFLYMLRSTRDPKLILAGHRLTQVAIPNKFLPFLSFVSYLSTSLSASVKVCLQFRTRLSVFEAFDGIPCQKLWQSLDIKYPQPCHDQPNHKFLLRTKVDW